MRLFNYLLAGISLAVLTGANAYACGLDDVKFGGSMDAVAKIYNITTKPGMTSGEAHLETTGKRLCSEFPDDTFIDFVFIDNQFVQIKIETPNIDGSLKKIAEKYFGDGDGKSKAKKEGKPVEDSKANKKDKTNHDIWASDKNKIIMYSAYNENGKDVEFIGITSRKHKTLFNNINQSIEQAIDEDLKKSGSGKYASGKKK